MKFLPIACCLMFMQSCNNEAKIVSLLKSDNKEDVILGAYIAGESNDKKYAKLLLQNCDDMRGSTNIRFKGITVYQSKMIALRKIFKKLPPTEITSTADSAVIKYFIEIAK